MNDFWKENLTALTASERQEAQQIASELDDFLTSHGCELLPPEQLLLERATQMLYKASGHEAVSEQQPPEQRKEIT